MSLWIDKHRPVELKELDHHQEQAGQLAKLVEGGDFPHLLVYGPPGAGKKVSQRYFNIFLLWYIWDIMTGEKLSI